MLDVTFIAWPLAPHVNGAVTAAVGDGGPDPRLHRVTSSPGERGSAS